MENSLYIPVQRPFQTLGLDIKDLPQGNKHIVIFQDYFTKWPMVFAVPDRIMELLTKEVILFCGVPEAVLMDVVIYAKLMGAIFLSNKNNWV